MFWLYLFADAFKRVFVVIGVNFGIEKYFAYLGLFLD
jgi:hypothetical protein